MIRPTTQELPLTILQREGLDALFRQYLIYRETPTASGFHLEAILRKTPVECDQHPTYLRMQLDVSDTGVLWHIACDPMTVAEILRVLLSQEGPLAFAQLAPQSSEMWEDCLAWYSLYQTIEQRVQTRWLPRQTARA